MKDFTTNRLITIDEKLTRLRKSYQIAKDNGDTQEMERIGQEAKPLKNEQIMLEGVIERRKPV